MIFKRYPTYQHLKFAHNVKLIVSILTSTTIEENYSREGKAMIPKGFDESLGTYQQKVGEGLRQIIGPDVWTLPITNHSAPLKIVSDVRYPNEVKAIENSGGIVIRLHRPDYLRYEALKGDTRNLLHESETALDDYEFQHIIVNDGTLDELEESLWKILL